MGRDTIHQVPQDDLISRCSSQDNQTPSTALLNLLKDSCVVELYLVIPLLGETAYSMDRFDVSCHI
jgi:hypothetical protein